FDERNGVRTLRHREADRLDLQGVGRRGGPGGGGPLRLGVAVGRDEDEARAPGRVHERGGLGPVEVGPRALEAGPGPLTPRVRDRTVADGQHEEVYLVEIRRRRGEVDLHGRRRRAYFESRMPSRHRLYAAHVTQHALRTRQSVQLALERGEEGEGVGREFVVVVVLPGRPGGDVARRAVDDLLEHAVERLAGDVGAGGVGVAAAAEAGRPGVDGAVALGAEGELDAARRFERD